MRPWLRLSAIAIFALVLAPARADQADDVLVGVARLRGGYDANPTLAVPARGSAFIGFDTALAATRELSSYRAGIAAESSLTNYSASDIDPQQRHKISLVVTNKDQDGLSLRSTSTMAYASTYNLRAFDAVQSVRAQWVDGVVRPFVTVEGRYATLNETNALYPDFLPVGSRYLRATAIPGIALSFGKVEVGSSVNVSVTHYLDEFDEFGYRRDNERIQPFLFFKYNSDNLDMFASVSQFFGFWHDPDFSNVNRTMFNVKAEYRLKPFTFEVAATRDAAETTFPLSPITVVTTFGGKAKWAVTDKDVLSIGAFNARTEYLDTALASDTRSYAFGYTHALMRDLTLGLDLSYTQFAPIAGDRAYATVGMLSLTKRFGADEKTEKKDTGGTRPPVRVAARPPVGTLPAWAN